MASIAALAAVWVPRPVFAVTADTGAGPWHYGSDMVAQTAAKTNGGLAANDFSSNTAEIPEECVTPNPGPSGTQTCGRGELGSIEPFGAVILNNLDSVNSSLTFGCPTAPNTTTVASGTATGTSGKPPAVIFTPGNFAGGLGGNPSNGDNITGDNQCYSPYVNCSTPTAPNTTCSAALPTAKKGNVWEATGTTTARDLEAAVYIAPTSPDGNHTAGASCSGRILVAGGQSPSTPGTAKELKSTELYDPRVTISGTANSSFNSWAAGPDMNSARDTPALAVLNDGRVLLAGGETSPGNSFNPTNSYELFDPATCSFESIINSMVLPNSPPSAKGFYDFNLAVFQSSGKVLACGGTIDNSFDITNLCQVFTPGTYGAGGSSGGSWSTTGVTPMVVARSGAAAQTLPNGTSVVEIGGNSASTCSGGCPSGVTPDEFQVSEECTVSGCNTHVANYAPDPNYKVLADKTENPTDPSHQLIGALPAGSPSNSTSGIAGVNGTLSPGTNHFNGLVLECGGFGFFQGTSLNVATNRACEYYVPTGTSTSSLTGVTCTAATGPAWCASSTSVAGAAGNIDLQRERAYFSMQEVPGCATSSVCPGLASDTVLAMGGFYGTDGTTCGNGCPNYLTRKNVEYLVEG